MGVYRGSSEGIPNSTITPCRHRNYIEEWANMRNIYSRAIVYEEKKIILQHRDALFPKNVDISHENKSGRLCP